jgi:hypothetical protein
LKHLFQGRFSAVRIAPLAFSGNLLAGRQMSRRHSDCSMLSPELVPVALAIAYHPKERVRNPTDGALTNLSNALWWAGAPKAKISP